MAEAAKMLNIARINKKKGKRLVSINNKRRVQRANERKYQVTDIREIISQFA